ncbi:hypothetical protein DFJ73DRAFT_841526, partial [Zopfochytrium polystomum]
VEPRRRHRRRRRRLRLSTLWLLPPLQSRGEAGAFPGDPTAQHRVELENPGCPNRRGSVSVRETKRARSSCGSKARARQPKEATAMASERKSCCVVNEYGSWQN